MNEIKEESEPVKIEEKLSKTFETTAETLFGSITNNEQADIQSTDNQEKKNIKLDSIVDQSDNEILDNKTDLDNNISAANDEKEANASKNSNNQEFDMYQQNEISKENKIEAKPKQKAEILADSQNQKSESSDSSKKNKDEITSISKQILDGTKDPLTIEFDDTLPVLTYLTLYRNEKMAAHEVDEAEKSDYIISKIIQNYKDTLKSINREKKEKIIKNKLQKAEKKLQRARDFTNRSISELKTQNDQSLQSLQTKHNKEFNNLFDKFNSPAIQRQYMQASHQLRTLRFQIHLLQNSKRFDELKIAQKSAADEEKRQIDEVNRSMSSHFQNQMKLLEEKHRSEIESQQIAFEDKETRLRVVCGRKTNALKNHINNIMTDLQMLQTKQTESSQTIMQKGEMMLKVSKATAARPSTSFQKKKNSSWSSSAENCVKKGEINLISTAADAPDIFSLKLPPLSRSRGVKEKREKLLESYKT